MGQSYITSSAVQVINKAAYPTTENSVKKSQELDDPVISQASSFCLSAAIEQYYFQSYSFLNYFSFIVTEIYFYKQIMPLLIMISIQRDGFFLSISLFIIIIISPFLVDQLSSQIPSNMSGVDARTPPKKPNPGLKKSLEAVDSSPPLLR